MTRTPLLLCSLLLLILQGCGTSMTPVVLDPRDVPRASGPPEITAIVDIGTGEAPRVGDHVDAAGGQRAAVIGELLLVRGSGFGKQPRVEIGGRGCEVLAHVKGGVVVRVPLGIDSGDVEVKVTHPGGSHSRRFAVRRLALVATGKAIRVLSVAANGGLTAGPTLALPGARRVVFSHDGSVAYVGGEQGGKVWVKTLDIAGAVPRVMNTTRVKGTRLVALVSAVREPLHAVVTDTHLVLFHSRTAIYHTFYEPLALGRQLTQKIPMAAALGGEGKHLALLLADLNEVALFDLAHRNAPRLLGEVKVLPGEPLQLVQDLQFAPDGGSLWVASGDNARSIQGGRQPARITMLLVGGGGDKGDVLKVHRTWAVGQDLAVFSLAVARGEPRPPGTAIRAEPSTSAVYLSVAPSEVLTDGPLAALKGGAQGSVVRSSLDHDPKPMLTHAAVITSQDLAGKTQVLVGLGLTRSKDGKPTLTALGRVAWRKGQVRTLSLGPLPASTLHAKPLWLGQVRCQP